MMKSVIISSRVVRVAGRGWVSPNASRRPATLRVVVSTMEEGSKSEEGGRTFWVGELLALLAEAHTRFGHCV